MRISIIKYYSFCQLGKKKGRIRPFRNIQNGPISGKKEVTDAKKVKCFPKSAGLLACRKKRVGYRFLILL